MFWKLVVRHYDGTIWQITKTSTRYPNTYIFKAPNRECLTLRNHFNIPYLVAKCMSVIVLPLYWLFTYSSHVLFHPAPQHHQHSMVAMMITTATLFSQISSPEPRPRPLNSDLQAAATTALPSAIEKAASSKSKATTTSKTNAGGLKSTSTGGMSPNSSSCPQVSTVNYLINYCQLVELCVPPSWSPRPINTNGSTHGLKNAGT